MTTDALPLADPGPVARFSTLGLDGRSAFEKASRFYEELAVGMDVSGLYRTDFRLDTGILPLGKAAFSHGEVSGLTGRRVLRDNQGSDAIVIQRVSAPYSHRQSGTDTEFPAGQTFAIAFDAPAEIAYAADSVHDAVWIDRADIAARLPRLDPYALTRLPPTDPAVSLMYAYAAAVWSSPGDDQTRRIAGLHLTDLAVLALSPVVEEQALSGARAARYHVLKAEVDRDFARPEMSVAWLAARHGVTTRYVQKLFEAQGLRFSDYLADRRMEAALRALTDPRRRHVRVSEIAWEVGFSDLTVFNRQFRKRHGDTPRGVRPK